MQRDEGQEAVASRGGGRPHSGELLRQRSTARLLVVVPPILLALFALGISLWRCPLMASTGCRCPGCGLTRAFGALLKGDLPVSFALHPFALVFALGWLVLAMHLVLGSKAGARLEHWVDRVEGAVPLSTWLMWAFVAFGVGRLALDVCRAAGIG